MSRESLIMTKPGSQELSVRHDIYTECLLAGLDVNLLGNKKLKKEDVYLIYGEYSQEEWFTKFVDYLTSGEIAVFVTGGNGAVEKTLEIRDRIRNKYATDRERNAVHAPKTEEAAEEGLKKAEQIFEDHKVLERIRFRRATGFDIPVK